MTPPPMMTARACEGSAGMREPLAEKETTRSRLEATAMARPEGFCPSRSEEHTSELQSLMRISYAVFCLKKKKKKMTKTILSHYNRKTHEKNRRQTRINIK